MTATKPKAAAATPRHRTRPAPSPAAAAHHGGPFAMVMQAMQAGMTSAEARQLVADDREWQDRAARKAYIDAMILVKKDVPQVLKTRTGEVDQGDGTVRQYGFATLGDVSSALTASLAEHGFVHRWEPQNDGNVVTVTCVLTHAGGHSERASQSDMADGGDRLTASQGTASATTQLERLTLIAVTGVAPEDMPDDDGASAAPRGAAARDAPPADQEPEPYPADEIAAGLPVWRELIAKGRKTADQVIAQAQTRFPRNPMTDDQKAAVRAPA